MGLHPLKLPSFAADLTLTSEGIYFMPTARPDGTSIVRYLEFKTGGTRDIVHTARAPDYGLPVSLLRDGCNPVAKDLGDERALLERGNHFELPEAAVRLAHEDAVQLINDAEGGRAGGIRRRS